MSPTEKLNKILEKLSEELEDKPDPWFNAPRGFLMKPDFKREQQKSEYIASGRDMNIFARFGIMSSWTSRYFVLFPKSRILKYYDRADMAEEKGYIDLNIIEKIDYSHVRDAGKFSFDLINSQQHFTLSASSADEMHKWALALKRCLLVHQAEAHLDAAAKVSSEPEYARESVSGESAPVVEAPESRWTRYDYTFEEPGPMHMSVMGSANKDQYGNLLNQWVIVTAFEMTADGLPGRAEASGVIAVKDYVIGVNGIDLTTFTFNDAIDAIADAEFPKTLHLLRDNEASKQATRIESWATVYYPALNRRRRRYCEIKDQTLIFRKPAPGGSATAERDAFFVLDHIARVTPVRDLNATGENEQEFQIQLHCKPGATVQHVGHGDMSVGGSPLEIMELCFSNENLMLQWRSVLIGHKGTGQGIVAEPVMVIPKGEVAERTFSVAAGNAGDKSALLLESKDLAIKSTLTGNLTNRIFTLSADGIISWRRPPIKGKANTKTGAAKKLFIADASRCDLIRFVAQETNLGTLNNIVYTYQLGLQTMESSLIICFSQLEAMKRWSAAIEALVVRAPKLTIPAGLLPFSSVERVDAESALATDGSKRYFEVIGDSKGSEEYSFKGYLYKRNDLLLPKGFSPQAGFAKVWVELQHLTMHVYRNQIEVESGVKPFSLIPLVSVIEVHEATDAGVPENSFEVVTTDKVYIFSATDEDAMLLWIEAMSDMMEVRETAIQEGWAGTMTTSANASKNAPTDSYIQQIKNAIVFSGGVTMKSVNLYTGIVSWRDRFLVLTSGSLAYYGDAKDVFSVEADSIGEVNLVNILSIQTCSPESEPKVQKSCAFELSAYVTKGGDEKNTRVFIFECRTPELCLQWMESIAQASGRYDIIPHATLPGHYESLQSTEKMKEQARLRANFTTGRPQSNALNRRTSAFGGAGRGNAFQHARPISAGFEAHGESIDEPVLPPPPPQPAGMDEEEEKKIRALAAQAAIIPNAPPETLQNPAASGGVRAAASGAGRGGRGGRGFSAPVRKTGSGATMNAFAGPKDTQI